MNIAIVQLESTLEERTQIRKRLAAALATIVGEEIMRNSRLIRSYACWPCFKRDAEIVPLIEVWDENLGQHVVICPRERERRGDPTAEGEEHLSDIIRRATAEYSLAKMRMEAREVQQNYPQLASRPPRSAQEDIAELFL